MNLNEFLLFVDQLEVLVEAFDLANRDFLEVNVGGVAEYFSEEVLLLVFSEEVLLVLSKALLSLCVNPCEEEGLVGVEVRLLYEHLPQNVNVLSPQGHLLVRNSNYVLKEVKHLAKTDFMLVLSDENTLSNILRELLFLLS